MAASVDVIFVLTLWFWFAAKNFQGQSNDSLAIKFPESLKVSLVFVAKCYYFDLKKNRHI